MSTKNPTLVHFRHFSSLLTHNHRVSSYLLAYKAPDNRQPATGLYICRESSTNSPFLCKTNPISPDFAPKTRILPKNKANSNPIKPNSNPIQSQFKPNSNPIKPNFKPVPLVAAKPLAKPDEAVPQFLSTVALCKGGLILIFIILFFFVLLTVFQR